MGARAIAPWAAGAPTQIELEDPFRVFSGLVNVYERQDLVYQTHSSGVCIFNEQSFRADKPTSGVRMFCLGGSSSYGYPWGVQDAFTSVLGEAMAVNHTELHVEVINSSGVSYAMHRLNIVVDELLTYEPDIVIVYSGHNTFIKPAFFEALKRRSTSQTRLAYVLAHSRVFSGIRAALASLKSRHPTAG